MKLVLIKRYIGFIEKIRNSQKTALKMLMMEAMKDVRSVTGSNMRNIMLLLGKSSIESVKLEDLESLTYFRLGNEDRWKIPMIKEIVDIKSGEMEVPGFELEELNDLLHHLCTE